MIEANRHTHTITGEQHTRPVGIVAVTLATLAKDDKRGGPCGDTDPVRSTVGSEGATDMVERGAFNMGGLAFATVVIDCNLCSVHRAGHKHTKEAEERRQMYLVVGNDSSNDCTKEEKGLEQHIGAVEGG